MIKKQFIGTTILTCSLILGAAPALAGGTPTAPVASPNVYKILSENDQWRVMEATWKPGQEDNFHSHTADRVSLYKTNCKLRLTKPDGTFKDVSPKAGTAKGRTGKPTKSHKAKNIGKKKCVINIVELK